MNARERRLAREESELWGELFAALLAIKRFFMSAGDKP